MKKLLSRILAALNRKFEIFRNKENVCCFGAKMYAGLDDETGMVHNVRQYNCPKCMIRTFGAYFFPFQRTYLIPEADRVLIFTAMI